MLLAGCGVQDAETPVAVRLERPHTPRLSQGESLMVVRFGLVDVRGMVAHCDVAKQTAGMCLVAVSYVSAGKFVEAFGQRPRCVHTADEQACCAQFGEHQLMGKHRVVGKTVQKYTLSHNPI